MDNPEKPATQDTVRRKKHNTEDQKDQQHEPQQNPRVNPSTREKANNPRIQQDTHHVTQIELITRMYTAHNMADVLTCHCIL